MRSLSLRTSDGHVLAADVAVPHGTARAAVVVCHPHPQYGGNRFNPVVEALFSTLPSAGFTTLRFDFRAAYDGGVGERLDVVAAVDALAGAGGPLFLVGYSFGAFVALTTDDQRVGAIVAVAPPLTAEVAAPLAPTVLLTPRHDQFCPPATAAAIVATWPSVELGVVESADHFLAGRSGEVAERTAGWLTNRLPAAQ